jgi:hypothetical protein
MPDCVLPADDPVLATNATVARMVALAEGWQQAGDRRSIFLECYTLMTGNMLRAVQAGRFHDAPWVSALLHHFADYYFDALAAYEQEGNAAPPVWEIAFATARQDSAMALQHLLLGVNAHINYDLMFAVADLLAPDWDELPAGRRAQRYADHCQVNQIIAETVDVVQDGVLERYSPALDLVDRVFGPVDEWAIAKMIAAWRDEVWEHAVRWVEAASDEERAVLRGQVEEAALRQARRIL